VVKPLLDHQAKSQTTWARSREVAEASRCAHRAVKWSQSPQKHSPRKMSLRACSHLTGPRSRCAVDRDDEFGLREDAFGKFGFGGFPFGGALLHEACELPHECRGVLR